MKTTMRWASALFLLSGCGDPGVLSGPAAPRVERAAAPACGAGDCVLKSSGVFPGEPGAGLQFAELAAQQGANRGGAVLQDILAHLPAQYGNTYYDEDPITHGHETSHGIHSHIRNTMNNTGGRANGFYVLQDRAVLVPEPGIRKAAAGPFIPQSLRGSRYATYITGQQAWDDTPLYIWDEWNAYVNGGAAGVDLVNGGQWNRGWRDGVAGVLEFTVYAIAVAMAVEEGDPGYFQENRQFREFLAWNTRRAMEVFRAGKDLEAFRWDRQDAYYEALRTAPDAEAFRAFCRRFFGAAWADAVIFGEGGVPPVEQPEVPDDEPEQPPADPNIPPPPESGDPPINDPLGGGPRPDVEIDTDGDSVFDADDLCSETPADADVWLQGEWMGCAHGQIRDRDRLDLDGPDLDVDGVPDAEDHCSGTGAGLRVWRSGEWAGCAEGQFRDPPPLVGEDADFDGIADDLDLCSGTPEGALIWLEGDWMGCAEGQRRDG
ncbi:MAG: hypothetical protein H6706_30830 [Myxococcales bacterium]|nr:hypothetical protein [Myxococcales bacterium]